MPWRFVCILPEANSGALLQTTPVEGVLAGTRLVPLITVHELGAISLPPNAVVTSVMRGRPVAPVVTAPLPVKVTEVPSGETEIFTVTEPVAPAYAPVPPVITSFRLGGGLSPMKLRKKEML